MERHGSKLFPHAREETRNDLGVPGKRVAVKSSPAYRGRSRDGVQEGNQALGAVGQDEGASWRDKQGRVHRRMKRRTESGRSVVAKQL